MSNSIQFTGYFDKNGIPIAVGDLVRMKSTVFSLAICTAGLIVVSYNPIGGQMFNREWIAVAFVIGAFFSFLNIVDD